MVNIKTIIEDSTWFVTRNAVKSIVNLDISDYYNITTHNITSMVVWKATAITSNNIINNIFFPSAEYLELYDKYINHD